MLIKKVFLCETIAESAYERLCRNFEVTDSLDDVSEIEGIITRNKPVDRNLIASAKKLKVIANHGSGSDFIDLKAAAEYGVAVENAPGLNSRSVAELALGFLLALNFKMKMNDAGLKEGRFKNFGTAELRGHEVYGKKPGIIGSGNIARQLASILKNGFGCNEIYCWNPRRTAKELKELGFKKIETLEELFASSDFISIHIPLTPQTENLIDRKIFASANPDMVLINTAGGGIVNEADLFDALVTKKIRAAACDVFKPKPLSKESHLLSLENFMATYHVGGNTQKALDRVGNKTVENIEKHLL